MATLPENDAPWLISPAILASLDIEAHRTTFGGPVRDLAPLVPAPEPRADWLADCTHWMITNSDRVSRWIERAILALIAAMVAMMIWHLGPLALRAVL